MNAKIDLKEFRDTLRPKNPELLTAAHLQPFVLFLLLRAEEQLRPAIIEARNQTLKNGNPGTLAAVESIERDFERYYRRLLAYLEELNSVIAAGDDLMNDPAAALPVSLPLFRGMYPNTLKLDRDSSPLCRDIDRCYKQTPDIVTTAMLHNQLVEYDIFTREIQERFLEDLYENTRNLLSGKTIQEFVLDILPEDLPQLPGKSKFSYALYGAVGALGLLAAYKLLK